MPGNERRDGASPLDQTKSLLGPQLRSRLTTRAMFERIDSSRNTPRRDLISSDERAALVEAVTGSLRPGTYLDVGHGLRPYYLHTPREFSQQSPYVGVDGHGADGYANPHSPMQRNARDTRSRLIQAGLPSHVSLEIADGRHVDFLTDGSTQEAFMGDVVASPGMKFEAKYGLFTETRRLLDPITGILVIREGDIFDPDLSSTEFFRGDRAKFAEMAFALDLAGFQRRIILDENDGAAAEAVAAQFGEDLLGRQYIIAQPKEIPVPDKPTRLGLIWKK